ncbi:MAG: hypothetical protein GYB65_15785 [Chloroflexi bacterium]|nr:hypothetical protein [Chloroflexota bacterium]
MADDKKAALIARIRDVFADHVYPGDGNIVRGYHEKNPEGFEFLGRVRGKHWREVSPTLLEKHQWGWWLCYLTEQAFGFFLPAVMLAILDNPEEMDDTTGTLLFNLIPVGIECLYGLDKLPTDASPAELDQAARKAIEAPGEDGIWDSREAREEAQKEFDERVGELSLDKKAVLRQFLEYLRDAGDEDADLALYGYWNRF